MASVKITFPSFRKAGFISPSLFIGEIKFSDNLVVEVADKKEHCEALKTWHKANPTVKERAQFVFPINIYWVEKDSKTMYTISNHDEMRELHGKCKDSKDSDRKN